MKRFAVTGHNPKTQQNLPRFSYTNLTLSVLVQKITVPSKQVRSLKSLGLTFSRGTSLRPSKHPKNCLQKTDQNLFVAKNKKLIKASPLQKTEETQKPRNSLRWAGAAHRRFRGSSSRGSQALARCGRKVLTERAMLFCFYFSTKGKCRKT